MSAGVSRRAASDDFLRFSIGRAAFAENDKGSGSI